MGPRVLGGRIMKIIEVYVYQGNNGTITSPIKIPGIESIKKIRLGADAKKILTNGNEKTRMKEVSEEEVALWYEIDATEEDYRSGLIVDRVNYKELLDVVTGADAE